MNDGLGKKAEAKIKEWLDKPELGYSFDRFYDQLSGYYLTSRNICDFLCYKYPNLYYIESKTTIHDRFDFNQIQPHQHDGLLAKSKIQGCYGLIIVLFSTYKRAVILKIQDVINMEEHGIKSINITKIDKWKIPYVEIPTIPNSRKSMLDYIGNLEELVNLI